MRTNSNTWMTGEQDVARRITNALYQYVAPDEVDVPRVLDMYDWVRDVNFHDGDAVDLPGLARRWIEYERGERESDWLMRAFGE